jgi:hypothetical protein
VRFFGNTGKIDQFDGFGLVDFQKDTLGVINLFFSLRINFDQDAFKIKFGRLGLFLQDLHHTYTVLAIQNRQSAILALKDAKKNGDVT